MIILGELHLDSQKELKIKRASWIKSHVWV